MDTSIPNADGAIDHIADPTDFLRTSIPTLTRLDASLRCEVCKDLFDTPVVTSCAHTFCSRCIRRCLSADGRCPTCRKEDQAGKLRKNGALEEVVESWKAVRRPVLRLTTDEKERAGEGEEKASRKRKVGSVEKSDESGSAEAGRNTRRRVTRSSAAESFDGGGRSTRAATRRAEQAFVVDSEGEEEDILSKDLDDNRAKFQNSSADPSHSPQETAHNGGRKSNHDDDEYKPDDGLVSCPMCSKRMKEEAVFPHLDHCSGSTPDPPKPTKVSPKPTRIDNEVPWRLQSFESHMGYNDAPPPEPQSTSQLRQIPTARPPPKPQTQIQQAYLPHLNASLLGDAALRKKLKELGIPNTGSRQQLIRRRTEWANIWNANCDSTRPRPKSALLSDLDEWERSEGALAGSGAAHPTLSFGGRPIGASAGMTSGQGSGVMAKDFDGAAWIKQNKTDFEDLIARARQGRAKKPQAEQSTKSAEDTSPAGPAGLESSAAIPAESDQKLDSDAQAVVENTTKMQDSIHTNGTTIPKPSLVFPNAPS